MRWLKRLLDINKDNPALLDWLSPGGENQTAATSASSPRGDAQPSFSVKSTQDDSGSTKSQRKRKRRRGSRWTKS
jgi:hypothetical protein